ncbi:L-arabinose ABC transporter ATP-binding protein AraG [Lichenicola cladoniae]|uniref:L-arabinose ABC transporter ATP-binding protein AraG n=1 Tax=Lichenicola cladoniae TaxID=1484109 RepID=A0A6M8HNF9_9PROT|nr:L-arabinose ABC transporter ATP-binding protein AraG [Lichenicola cladoniae]NPD67446.1 L-arabinose ABC transporter ATP-binding protein AraG [Acetobacteraceae bacterium]QKE89934.1 L-arabinose ABC transporter ATP-binding protein AraG [Lichenicola cladoniae]
MSEALAVDPGPRDDLRGPEPFLTLAGIEVEFPGVKALRGVDLFVERGSVHGLMGENGAGKSTLLKVLSGVNLPKAGTITVAGKQLTFRGASDALEAGIAIIYQELHLVPGLSAAENLMLGHLPRRGGLVDRKALRIRAEAVLRDLGEDIDPSTPVGRLSIGQRQMVEIGKALLRNAQIIAFDEPTSSLSSREVENLKRIVRRLRDEGRAIVYVTHRMAEVFELCDAVTVFRDGACVARHPDIADVTPDQLVTEMVGRAIEDVYGYRPRKTGDVLVEVENIAGPGIREPISFSLRKGEILGFFGLVGAGRTELMRLICGTERATGGKITLQGKVLKMGSPRRAISAGIAMCPEDRKREGIFPIASVDDNINISVRRRYAKFGIVNFAREKLNAAKAIRDLDIRTRNGSTPIRNLSGGNQQKAILGRWLSEDIELFVLDEPTRGIDVGARAQIYEILYGLAEKGVGVIVVSSDLSEVSSISDRVIVMADGCVTANFSRDEITPERLLSQALPR